MRCLHQPRIGPDGRQAVLARSAGLANGSRAKSKTCSAHRWWPSANRRALHRRRRESGLHPGRNQPAARQLADTTVLDEFWITDEKGHAYLRNIDVDFTFSPSALEQPQAHVFWPLLTGKNDKVIQEARQREIDDQHFKYAGVAGVDKPRIVQVGFNAKYLDDLKARSASAGRWRRCSRAATSTPSGCSTRSSANWPAPRSWAPASARFPSETEMQSIRWRWDTTHARCCSPMP